MSPKDRPIIILSTGRAGSTLLQKLLNTHEEMLIWGEHAGILNYLMNASRVITNTEWIPDHKPKGDWLLQENRPLNVDKWTAWDGSFSKDGFHKHMRRFIDDLFSQNVPDNVRWGFKEIRYRNIDLMDFISNIYPQVKFILLLRNPIDSCISFTSASAAKGSKTPTDFNSTMCKIADNQIKPTFQFFKEAIEHYSNNSYVVFFEQLVEFPQEVLNDISDFLELSKTFEGNLVSLIMQNDMVSERQQTSKQQQNMLKGMATPLLVEQLDWYEHIYRKLSSYDKAF